MLPPYLGHPMHVANLTKKLLKRVAVLARIKKKILPVIILVNASIKPVLEYCVSVWGSCDAGLLNEIFKVQKIYARIILDAPFQSRPLLLFLEPGWLPINQICYERRLFLLKKKKKIMDGCTPNYLSEKQLSLKSRKSHCTRSRLPYRLPVPRNNSMIRMFFYNAVKVAAHSFGSL